jgi:hypothetical protein
MYNYHKKHNKASNVYECENRSLLRKAVKGDKSALRRASSRLAPANLPKRLYIPGLKRRGFTARMVSSKEKRGKVE